MGRHHLATDAELDWFIEWERAARPEIRMLPGGGIIEDAIKIFCKTSPIRAFHVGLAARDQEMVDGVVLAERVRELAELIKVY